MVALCIGEHHMGGPILFWLVIIVVIISISVIVLLRNKNYKSLVVSAVTVIAIPFVMVGKSCIQNSSSEACVWGQSFMPFYLGLAVLVGTPILFLLISFFAWVYRVFAVHNNHTK